MDTKRKDRWEAVTVMNDSKRSMPCSIRFGGKELFLLPDINGIQASEIEKMLNIVAIPATL